MIAPENFAATTTPADPETTRPTASGLHGRLENAEADNALARDWIRGVANGDRTCFRNLHDRFGALLFSTIFRVLNDRQDTEDVMQEVFALVWRKAGLYSPEKGTPTTWLASMARNRAIDRLRLKQRRARLGEQHEAEVQVQVGQPHHASAGEELVLRRERCAEVRKAVFSLAPDQQEAIRLAYFDGMSQKEIAEQLGKPLGTVKARIRRGMEKLRGRL